jgi:16S rRNA pseudouridine516 synthase
VLQSQGFGTRKYCRALIEDGDVAVNGDVHDNYKTLVETDGLVLTVFDEEWTYREHVYIALYKPSNYECSRKPSHHPGVLTLLPEQFTWREVQPVGRLDHDTTGLLLMSDDGAFIHAQSSPKRHIPFQPSFRCFRLRAKRGCCGSAFFRSARLPRGWG